ncbi:BrnT family toxin [Polynucleobacter sp. MWH-UH35A]|uniref:BrnT family toxin n=1 Tax=Polynucleobacter sp. MWH-UH35A TaxID=1855619 RepID=UPI001BFE2AB5|nr:BrnT family toxin [Polynucleobacter sp. MWH-UH35A]QWD60411.1 BrnT family toxin [Polynucleobacter sp. MWH-UH35A]
MIDFQRITGFQLDAGNAYKSREKHDVTQGEAEEIFFNQPLMVSSDEKHSQGEQRYLALGVTSVGEFLSAVFTLRKNATLIRVVSARPMSKKERAFYEKA